jgi:hypothetical protein
MNMSEISTEMYNRPTATSSDPMHEMLSAIQIRNAMGNIAKVKGGMPGTQSALDSCGAGQPMATTDMGD